MRNLLTMTIAVVLLSAAGCAFAADWPRFRGPDADGMSPEKGINKDWRTKPPKMLWKVRMGDRGYAGPSVADGKVFIIDHQGADDVVRAIDIKAGNNVWTFRYKDSPKENYGFARATPTVDGDKIYTMSRLGLLHCLTVKDGKRVWSVNIIKKFGGKLPGWQLAGSPFIDGDKVVVTPGGKGAAVVALNKNTGETIWKGGGSDKPGYATPVAATINGKKQYVVFTAFNLIGVDAENGKLLWKLGWRTQHDVNAATPIVSGDRIFITSNYGRGCVLLKITGDKVQPVWQNRTIQSHFSTPVLSGGHLYGSTNTGKLACLDWKTGATKWTLRGFEKGGVVGVDGALIALDGRTGAIVMVEMTPNAAKELGRLKGLGGQSWTAPIVADGKLIVRNKAELACYDLK